MAYFAELDENNIVINVIAVHNNELLVDGVESEEKGIAFCNTIKPAKWVKTSFNTYKNQHSLGGTPFRKNYASIGGTYDAERDAFIPAKRWDSWILDEETCHWIAPIPNPDNRHQSEWDEENQAWLPRE